MRAFLDRLYLACGAIAATFLALIGLLILTSIISRWMGVYVPGLNAFSGYAMAASSFFALAWTFQTGGHIRVNIALGALKGRARWAAELWCLGVAGAAAAYIAWYVAKMTLVSLDFGDVSESADKTPLWIPQTALAIGSAVFALAVWDRFVVTLSSGEVAPEPDPTGQAKE